MAEIDGGMTLYDMSKNIIESQNPMDLIALNKNIKEICKKMIQYNYLMLYCKENSDFTIFKITNKNLDCFEKDLKETLSNRGAIIMTEEQDDGAWEFWIRDFATDENNVYYLFNYESAIIEVI